MSDFHSALHIADCYLIVSILVWNSKISSKLLKWYLKNLFLHLFASAECRISWKMHLLLKGDTNQANILNLFTKRKQNLVGFNMIWSIFFKLNLWLNCWTLYFQIKSSETIVKVSIYLHCVKPNNMPRLELNSRSAIQQWWSSKPSWPQLGNAWWVRLVTEWTCCLIYLKRQQNLGWWLKVREGVCDMQIILHFW